MSQENVEIVRRTLNAFRWGPEGAAPEEMQEVVSEFWDPDADYYPSRKFPESRPCHGREEIVRFFSEYFRAWDQVEAEPKALIAVGDHRVLAHFTLSSEGSGSGLGLRADLYACIWLRNARVLRWEDHFTPAAALSAFDLDEWGLEAAGLRE